jgi:hypothetical protein
MTKALKDMILGALDDAGGQAYLARQAAENPVAFMSLLGRVLPAEFKGELTNHGVVVYGAQPVTAEEWAEQYVPH